MADIELNVDEQGVLSPARISVQPGKSVQIQAERDTVFCIDESSVFGGSRFEIPAGMALLLIVQQEAASEFSFGIQVGDLSVRCKGDRAGDTGGRIGGPD